MYNYIKDMVQFFQDLEDGYFMQHSLDVSHPFTAPRRTALRL